MEMTKRAGIVERKVIFVVIGYLITILLLLFHPGVPTKPEDLLDYFMFLWIPAFVWLVVWEMITQNDK